MCLHGFISHPLLCKGKCTPNLDFITLNLPLSSSIQHNRHVDVDIDLASLLF